MKISLQYQIDLLQKVGGKGNYPPYNFLKLNMHTDDGAKEEMYVLEIAVAGFKENELKVEMVGDLLAISGVQASKEGYCEFLYRGIARRNFKQLFKVHNNLNITGQISLQDGLLRIFFILKADTLDKIQLFPINQKNLNLPN